jgi:hypothetical protein
MTTFNTDITVVDERSITIPNAPLNAGETEQIGKWILNNAQDGYGLKSATSITRTRGHQMNEYTETTGVKITLERKS